LILFTVVLSFSITAYAPNWDVDISNTLGSYSDGFTAGAGSPATGGYDITADLLQPGGPPTGPYIQMRTLVGGNILTKDYKADEVGVPRTWEITLVAVDPTFVGISGNNEMTWTLASTENIDLSLVDYGNDTTRSNIVGTLDLKEQSSYNFDVDSAMGPYRYLDLVAERTQEDQSPAAPSGGTTGGGGSVCTPRWQCTDWSECKNNKKTRTCSDERDCNRNVGKPAETEACVSLVNEPEEREEVVPQEIDVGEPDEEPTIEVEETKQEEGLSQITGAVVGTTPKGNVFIGILIMVVIVVVGLIVFVFITKK